MRGVAPQPVMIGNDVRFWPKADICGSIPDLLLTRVRNWTSVQLDFSAHNRDNQNDKFRAGSAA